MASRATFAVRMSAYICGGQMGKQQWKAVRVLMALHTHTTAIQPTLRPMPTLGVERVWGWGFPPMQTEKSLQASPQQAPGP